MSMTDVDDHPIELRDRETIVAGGDRRMGGEDASFPNHGDVLLGQLFTSPIGSCVPHELEREQSRMAFVHVMGLERVMSERLQHAYAADAEHDFLRQTVTLVAAVEPVR